MSMYLINIAGHLTFQCRNTVRVLNQPVHVDVSSTSSESSTEEEEESLSESDSEEGKT